MASPYLLGHSKLFLELLLAFLGVSWTSLGLSWLVLVSLGPLLASTDLFGPLLDLSWPLQASPGSFLDLALSFF